jgi:hypothetical protein
MGLGVARARGVVDQPEATSVAGNLDEAQLVLRRAPLKLSPSRIQARASLGIGLLLAGSIRRAGQVWTRAQEDDRS